MAPVKPTSLCIGRELAFVLFLHYISESLMISKEYGIKKAYFFMFMHKECIIIKYYDGKSPYSFWTEIYNYTLDFIFIHSYNKNYYDLGADKG